MNESDTQPCISSRHWLKIAQEVLSLILLGLRVYELLQHLHLI